MASVIKLTQSAVVNQLRHNLRQIRNSSNPDIDGERTHLNYALHERTGNTDDYGYYKKRLAELYLYHRADVKTMASWCVAAPKELETEGEIKRFFEVTYDFLKVRYGENNTIQAIVHFDEGKTQIATDRWGNARIDEDGQPMKEIVEGRPHLHYCFIPVSPDKNAKHWQTEKVCANEVLTRRELRSFHGDLQAYLEEHGIHAKVVTGAVKKQGRNYTVDELKEQFEAKKTREYERNYNLEQERSRWN